MAVVQAAEAGVRGFANAVRRMAIKDKGFCQKLVFNHGIRGEITPNALKGLTKDMFDASGKLTEKGSKEVSRMIEEFRLPKNATWDHILQALSESKKAGGERFNKIKELPSLIMMKIKSDRPNVLNISKINLPKIEFNAINKLKSGQNIKSSGMKNVANARPEFNAPSGKYIIDRTVDSSINKNNINFDK